MRPFFTFTLMTPRLRHALLALLAASAASALDLSVDCTATTPLAPFWRSVGYTPATYALRDDELENTALIGAVPNGGVAQVRIHYLLDLVAVLGFAPSNGSTPSGWRLDYDFSALDHALDWLAAAGLAGLPRFREPVARIYSYLDATQVKEDVPRREQFFRTISKGGWPFSTSDHGW